MGVRRAWHQELGRLLAGAAIVCALLWGASFVVQESAPAQDQGVRILRVMTSNPAACMPVGGEYRDWVELANLSDSTVDLDGWRLTGGLDIRGGCIFSKLSLGPGESVVVYGGKSVAGAPEDALFCGFNLSAEGASVSLSDAQLKTQDSLEIPSLSAGSVYALDPSTGEYAVRSLYDDLGVGLDLNAEIRAQFRADGLYISELMASNSLTIADQNGEYSDWIEIYNGSGAEVNLAGYTLTDDPLSRRKFVFPDRVLPAGGRLLVFASGREDLGAELHAAFKLSASGEQVLLIDPQGTVISSVQYDALESDQALMRMESGELEESYLTSPGYENTVRGARNSMDPAYLTPQSNALGLYINEAMCSVYGRNDWVELVNESGADLDLSGFGLSNNPYKPRKWQFPQGTVIPAGGYLVVQMTGADGAADNSGALCCNGFRLDGGSDELLLLSDGQGQVFDRMLLASQRRNVSYGRADSGSYRYFVDATPGAVNGGQSYGRCLRPVTFSRSGGIQAEPFQLELRSDDGATIYYTTDGSMPTASSNVYTGPLTISENVVIKAVAWGEDAIASRAAANSYLFNVQHTVGIVAVSGNPEELTGSDGTLNTGRVGDGYDVHAEIYDAGGAQLVSQGCQLKLNGRSSRLMYDQRAFRLVAKSEYGNNRFEAALFSDRDYEEYKAVLVRAAGQDNQLAFMRDAVLTSLAGNTSVMYQEDEVVAVYVNARYWGAYHLRERICPESICQFEGWSDPDAVDLIEGSEGARVQGSNETYKSMMAAVRKYGVSSDENLAALREWVDVENYLEYVMLQIYSNNQDLNNVRMYRSTEGDGRWRWILYDLDLGFRAERDSSKAWLSTSGKVGSITAQSNELFVALMRNGEMRDWFLTRFGELLATDLSSERVVARIQREYELLAPEMEMECARWDRSITKWQNNVARFTAVAQERTSTVIKQLVSAFELTQEEAQRYFGAAAEREGM